MVFKCGNIDVVDLTTGDVLNRNLLPVYSWNVEDVLKYLQRRVYARTNTTARIIENRDFQQDEHEKAFKLGLSDSYWVSNDKDLKFEDISPYYHPFNTLDFVRGFTSPTLRLAGSFDKEWQKRGNTTYIVKKQPDSSAQLETHASALAAKLGVGDKKTVLYGGQVFGQGTTYIPNISCPDNMLLDFGSVLGMECLHNGFNPVEVQQLYSQVGFCEITQTYILPISLFDMIIGNSDRKDNPGNWGFFKNSKTGETTTAPAYDFNLANITRMSEKYFSQRLELLDTLNLCPKAFSILSEWKDTVYTFCDKRELSSWKQNFECIYTAIKKF
ncbi:MAG: hypothetical protein FWH05_04705 [Oscillospiraceae bacterium]|nr:hypothetical protein [Oscillospiraceae bacterium]